MFNCDYTEFGAGRFVDVMRLVIFEKKRENGVFIEEGEILCVFCVEKFCVICKRRGGICCDFVY
jgi:hypothetical protein